MAYLTIKGYAATKAAGAKAGFFTSKPIAVCVAGTPATAAIPIEIVKAVTPARVRGVSTTRGSPVAAIPSLARYYAQGVVKVEGNPVSRFVRIRRRDTGAEITSGYSGTDGRFHLSWADYAGLVEVTVYDSAALLSPYNAKVFDFVTG